MRVATGAERCRAARIDGAKTLQHSGRARKDWNERQDGDDRLQQTALAGLPMGRHLRSPWMNWVGYRVAVASNDWGWRHCAGPAIPTVVTWRASCRQAGLRYR